jgi:hypothetical protein
MTGIRRALPPVLLAAAALTCAFALQRSLACPIQPPQQPLRTLYKLSARVVVARVGAKEVLKTEDDVASVRIALHVTENVKGAPVQLVHFYHTESVEDAAEQDEEELTVNAFSGRPVPRLKQGERYLFFLDRREEGDGYEVNDESYGIKQLSNDDLKVYLERMKELADLMRPQPEDKHALVEWLVRCAEQPATRWDGAYELLESAAAAERGDQAEAPKEQVEPEAEAVQAQAGASEASAPAAVEAPAAPGTQAASSSFAAPPLDPSVDVPVTTLMFPRLNTDRYLTPDPALVPLLDAVQKQRLSDALVASSEPSEGDDVLMQVAKEFGDPRLAGFLLARLHRFEDEAPMEAELWLRTLAASLHNKQLIELADAYTQDSAYYEWDEVEPEAATPADSAAAASGSTGGEEGAAEEEEPEDPEVEAARYAAAAERATLKRSATLKGLLERIDLFVSTGQLAPN